MTELEEIRCEIEELKKYKEFLVILLKKENIEIGTKNDKPKVKKLEVPKNDRI